MTTARRCRATLGPAPGKALVIRHNTIINDVGYSASLAPDLGKVHDVTVEDDLLGGGGYTVYGGAAQPPDRPWTPERVVFRNNLFSKLV